MLFSQRWSSLWRNQRQISFWALSTESLPWITFLKTEWKLLLWLSSRRKMNKYFLKTRLCKKSNTIVLFFFFFLPTIYPHNDFKGFLRLLIQWLLSCSLFLPSITRKHVCMFPRIKDWDQTCNLRSKVMKWLTCPLPHRNLPGWFPAVSLRDWSRPASCERSSQHLNPATPTQKAGRFWTQPNTSKRCWETRWGNPPLQQLVQNSCSLLGCCRKACSWAPSSVRLAAPQTPGVHVQPR